MHNNLMTFVSRSLPLVALAGATLWAQEVTQELKRVVESLELKTITGAPYSATAVTTSVQTLGDGTRITKTVQASLARDSEGRTRREQSLDSLGPWTTNVQHSIVSILDPVAQVRYILQPDGKTALKTPLMRASGELVKRRIDDTAAAELKARMDKAKVEVEKVRTENWVMVTTGGQNIGVAVTAQGRNNVQRDDLGSRVIEGVNATGRRETRTIQIGEVGNDRPIQITSETWYSDELQTVVFSKHSDPRVGDSEYKLTNVSRAEPSRNLFEVPAGYTVKEEGVRVISRE